MKVDMPLTKETEETKLDKFFLYIPIVLFSSKIISSIVELTWESHQQLQITDVIKKFCRDNSDHEICYRFAKLNSKFVFKCSYLTARENDTEC